MLLFFREFKKLRGFFSRTLSGHRPYSNYFILGVRKKHICIRFRSLVNVLLKLKIFLELSRLDKTSLWFVGVSRHFRLASILRAEFDINCLVFVHKYYIFFYWKKRFFRLRARNLNNKLDKILGVDTAIFINPRQSDSQLLPFLRVSGPSIVLADAAFNTLPGAYNIFYSNIKKYATLRFYLQVMLGFWVASQKKLANKHFT